MKKIYNNFLFNIRSSRLYIFIPIMTVCIFAQMIELINCGKEYNIYDYVIKVGSYLSLFYMIFIIFIVMNYRIMSKGRFNNYINIRFNRIGQVYKSDVLTCLIFSVGTVLFIVIVCLLSGSFMSFKNNWSQQGVYVITGAVNQLPDTDVINILLKSLSPLRYITITCLFVMLYLVTISLILIVCNLIFKRKVISLIVLVVVNSLSMMMDNTLISRVTFTNNIYIFNAELNEVVNGTYIISRLLYWVVVIGTLYIVGLMLSKKRDCIYEK